VALRITSIFCTRFFTLTSFSTGSSPSVSTLAAVLAVAVLIFSAALGEERVVEKAALEARVCGVRVAEGDVVFVVLAEPGLLGGAIVRGALGAADTRKLGARLGPTPTPGPTPGPPMVEGAESVEARGETLPELAVVVVVVAVPATVDVAELCLDDPPPTPPTLLRGGEATARGEDAFVLHVPVE